MKTIARIESPGQLTTIQDFGRAGLRHLGVPQGGAADRVSLALANASVGNACRTPALECVLTGLSLEFQTDIAFAIAGADMRPCLTGEAVSMAKAIVAKPGDKLEMGGAKEGATAYIAFAGGVAGARVMNSTATYLPGRFGGFSGRALRNGDKLRSANYESGAPREITAHYCPRLGHDWVLRACEGPDVSRLHPTLVERFFSGKFSASDRWSRMGLKLDGAQLKHETGAMASSAVYPGTVQLPPDGAPFLLAADAQTTGGYPRIAQVIAADLPLIGQIRPGDRLWFRRTTPDEARETSALRTSFYEAVAPGFSFI